MKKIKNMKKFAVLAICLSCTYATNALATVIDFENLVGDAYFEQPQLSGDFVFDDGNADSFGHGTAGIDGFTVNNGTQMLWDWSNSSAPTIMEMARQDGGTFDLSAFDFVSGYTDGRQQSSTLSVESFFQGNSLGSTLFSLGLDYFHSSISTLNVTVANADLVVFTGAGIDRPRNAFDNFVTNAVPEPGMLALLGLGIVGLGIRRRKIS